MRIIYKLLDRIRVTRKNSFATWHTNTAGRGTISGSVGRSQTSLPFHLIYSQCWGPDKKWEESKEQRLYVSCPNVLVLKVPWGAKLCLCEAWGPVLPPRAIPLLAHLPSLHPRGSHASPVGRQAGLRSQGDCHTAISSKTPRGAGQNTRKYKRPQGGTYCGQQTLLSSLCSAGAQSRREEDGHLVLGLLGHW